MFNISKNSKMRKWFAEVDCTGFRDGQTSCGFSPLTASLPPSFSGAQTVVAGVGAAFSRHTGLETSSRRRGRTDAE